MSKRHATLIKERELFVGETTAGSPRPGLRFRASSVSQCPEATLIAALGGGWFLYVNG